MSRKFTIPTEIYDQREAMGAAAAHQFQRRVQEVVEAKGRCRVIFGCAPSQDDFFRALVREAQATPGVWRRVEIFHMDEYIGLPGSHPQSFRTYLRIHFLNHVEPAALHLIKGEASSGEMEAERYATLIGHAPIDVIAMGIGENGHVAFNDPPVANFTDPYLVKVVAMDDSCRQQQVNDGCFSSLSMVPRFAVTITLPVFAQAGSLFCIVPGLRKARAVQRAFLDPVSPACPATILRVHPRARLFLDRDSASLYQSASGHS